MTDTEKASLNAMLLGSDEDFELAICLIRGSLVYKVSPMTLYNIVSTAHMLVLNDHNWNRPPSKRLRNLHSLCKHLLNRFNIKQ